MKALIILAAALVSSWTEVQAIETNVIYSLDLQNNGEGKSLSITIDPNTGNSSMQELSSSNGHQRFIARINSDNTFTLFLEEQPWNWVDHIVERTKFVNIQQIPKVLGVIGASRDVVQQDYQGTGANGQKLYIVPTGQDPNTGVLTSLLLRQCLTAQGENQPLTLTPCNWSDPNQVFTVTGRTSGRFC